MQKAGGRAVKKKLATGKASALLRSVMNRQMQMCFGWDRADCDHLDDAVGRIFCTGQRSRSSSQTIQSSGPSEGAQSPPKPTSVTKPVSLAEAPYPSGGRESLLSFTLSTFAFHVYRNV